MTYLAVLLCIGLTCHAYKNPIPELTNFSGPYVLRCPEGYYLYGITGTYFGDKKPNHGVRCYFSPDLVHWESKGWCFLKYWDTWGQYNFWDPKVFYNQSNGYYYLFCACTNISGDPTMRICISRSRSPIGPFKEFRAPFDMGFTPARHTIAPFVFNDDNGRNYLYWTDTSTTHSATWVQEISADYSTLLGKPSTDIAQPVSQSWEVDPGDPLASRPGGYTINEGPVVFKKDGIYYLLYSGCHYLHPNYAIGYATSSSPLGPFTKSPSNPILAKNTQLSPPASSPGTCAVINSPDNREMFMFYACPTHPEKYLQSPGDRQTFMDRMTVSNGVITVSGPTNTEQPDPSGTAASLSPAVSAPPQPAAEESPWVSGWINPGAVDSSAPSERTAGFVAYDTDKITTDALGTASSQWMPTGFNDPAAAVTDFDAATNSFRAKVFPSIKRFRHSGAQANGDHWMPYAAIGPNCYVRAKFYMFAGGQQNPSDLNQIPNLRVRAATRFAVSSILEIFHHLNADPANNAWASELRPSTDPTRPSLYQVDFDPVDVPYLVDSGSTEGVMRAFEAYALEPQENGYVAMTESVIGSYPKEMLPDSYDPAVLTKVYAPSASDAGDLKVVNPAAELSVRNLVYGIFDGDWGDVDRSDATLPSYYEAGTSSVHPPPGITMDSTAVHPTRVGVVTRELNPGPNRSWPSYVRVEEGKQYKIRFHITSTQQAASNAQLRLRARSIKFAWSQKYEVGGAWPTSSFSNYTMAQQSLPGIGCKNPDKNGSENGGWYTLLFNTPMSADIRPEFSAGTPLAQRMPHICSEPGPCVDAPSRRDLRVGIDLVDTFDNGANREQEKGNFTIDRVEVRTYNLVGE